MQLVSVAALAENRVIGLDGELPWPSIPADKRQYRALVSDAPVILGRRTFESMREDPPGAYRIVVSRSLDSVDDPDAVVVSTVEGAREHASRFLAGSDGTVPPKAAAYVLGGEAIYELFQPHVDRMVLSHVHGEYEGDTYYPDFETDEWTIDNETAYDRFVLREWRRVDR